MDKKDTALAKTILGEISAKRGMMWEKIATFSKQLNEIEGTINHKAGDKQSEAMKQIAPLKQNIEGGLYTREIFMPKGSVVVSMIHKQQHPSFC